MNASTLYRLMVENQQEYLQRQMELEMQSQHLDNDDRVALILADPEYRDLLIEEARLIKLYACAINMEQSIELQDEFTIPQPRLVGKQWELRSKRYHERTIDGSRQPKTKARRLVFECRRQVKLSGYALPIQLQIS